MYLITEYRVKGGEKEKEDHMEINKTVEEKEEGDYKGNKG